MSAGNRRQSIAEDLCDIEREVAKGVDWSGDVLEGMLSRIHDSARHALDTIKTQSRAQPRAPEEGGESAASGCHITVAKPA